MLVGLFDFTIFVQELFDAIFFGKFDSEINKGLLLLDELFVLDPVVARVDLADQIKSLLLLLLSDSTVDNLLIEVSKMALVSLMLSFTFFFIGVEVSLLFLLNGFADRFNRFRLYTDI